MSKTAKRVGVITMGCSKNLVDSEVLMRRLEDVGYSVVVEPSEDGLGPNGIVVINTCGFIGDAKEESVNEILAWCERLKNGKVGEVRVMGCLSERYRSELPAEIPEVTAWYGKTDWSRLVADLARRNPATAPYDRVITTPSHHAYLKIAEGCNRFCAFCAIPLITGRYRSRSRDEILDEVRMLVGRGVREFNVIAQDLSGYGADLGPVAPGQLSPLAALVDAIADIPGVDWIRLHYAYPAGFPMDLLDVMARRPNVCKYIDIALQHIADPVLTNMRRHIDAKATRELLAEMRRRVPGLHIRTTLMVGFPGEGPREFDELLDFVREQRFERMGAFAYCEEEDTFAARNFADDIPQKEKQRRLDRLMALQEEISDEIQQTKVGQTLRVIVDRREGDFMVGRTQWDSPEVDPEVMIALPDGRELKRGEFYNVKITSASPFELMAEIADD